jgi:hypothetical protein
LWKKEVTMKTVVASVVLLALSLVIPVNATSAASFATGRGSTLLAGEFLFSSAGGDLYETADGEGLTRIGIDPTVAYFVIRGLAVGGSFSFHSASQGDLSETVWGIGPRAMYFIGSRPRRSAKGATYPFLDVLFLYTKHSLDLGTDDWSATGTVIRFGGGVMYMISESAGLLGEVTYSLDSEKPEDGVSESGHDINIYAGFGFFLY